MTFSDNLRTLRSNKRLTQEELAELLDVSRQAVSKWESGNGYPEMDTLIKLSELFDVSLDKLVKTQFIEDLSTSNDKNPKDDNRKKLIILAVFSFIIFATTMSSNNDTGWIILISLVSFITFQMLVFRVVKNTKSNLHSK
ncbi:Helix-turn-helix [Carnobacterium iners]|uniref:Helix-turn-helix n=1 Tax=Carnobacterium iners TaxID=1073423 RepID=A0A1X7MSR7_9LACT|nr:helix-turn-helix transcriptional regulator [Carnobacterium iners]SEL33986.1 Helix-turn-helix [Carnobacterium iners]SMH26993.1 Helix-turn-helix [Carnobacterium iners]